MPLGLALQFFRIGPRYDDLENSLTNQAELSMENRWLSVDEIAAYLGIRRDTVYKWISEKDMPAHRIGRLWKFQRDEIDDWVRKDETSEQDRGTV